MRFVLSGVLFQDLDEAEEQYNMAFRSQIDHMNEMLDVHNARYDFESCVSFRVYSTSIAYNEAFTILESQKSYLVF